MEDREFKVPATGGARPLEPLEAEPTATQESEQRQLSEANQSPTSASAESAEPKSVDQTESKPEDETSSSEEEQPSAAAAKPDKQEDKKPTEGEQQPEDAEDKEKENPRVKEILKRFPELEDEGEFQAAVLAALVKLVEKSEGLTAGELKQLAPKGFTYDPGHSRIAPESKAKFGAIKAEPDAGFVNGEIIIFPHFLTLPAVDQASTLAHEFGEALQWSSVEKKGQTPEAGKKVEQEYVWPFAEHNAIIKSRPILLNSLYARKFYDHGEKDDEERFLAEARADDIGDYLQSADAKSWLERRLIRIEPELRGRLQQEIKDDKWEVAGSELATYYRAAQETYNFLDQEVPKAQEQLRPLEAIAKRKESKAAGAGLPTSRQGIQEINNLLDQLDFSDYYGSGDGYSSGANFSSEQKADPDFMNKVFGVVFGLESPAVLFK